MTELFTKNLISTKEASLLSGYNPDYLARLCRAQKIIGRQVGRNWFVDQDSLDKLVKSQIDRKRELAQNLSQVRAHEYHQPRAPEPPPEVKIKLPETARRSLAPLRVSPLMAPRFAVLTAVLVVAGACYASASPGFERFGNQVVTLATALESAPVTYDGPAVFVDVRDDALVLAIDERVPSKEEVAARIEKVAVNDVEYAKTYEEAQRVARTYEYDRIAHERLNAVATFARDPQSAFVREYIRLGIVFERGTQHMLTAYERKLNDTGKDALVLAEGIRDEARQAPARVRAVNDAYENAVYAWVGKSPELARSVTEGTLVLGNVVGGAAAETPHALVASSEEQVRSLVSKALESSDGVSIPRFSYNSEIQAVASLGSLPNALLSGFGKVWHATVGTAQRLVSAGTRLALSLLPGGEPPLLVVLPFDEPLVLAPYSSADVPGPDSPIRTVYQGATTVIRNYYPQTVVQGVTKAELEAGLAGLRDKTRTAIRGTYTTPFDTNNSNFSGTLRGENATLTGDLSVGGNATVTGSLTAASSTITNDLTVGGTVTAGSLSVGGVTSSGAVTAPYFTATLTTDVPSFPNLVGRKAPATNATPTNFFATNLRGTDAVLDGFVGTNATVTNPTTTNFFSSLARATTGIIDTFTATVANITTATIATLSGTDLTFTNATTTNATSTNMYAASLRADNATSTSLYATTLGIGSNYFTSLLGNGLVNVGGTLTVSTTSLASGFFLNGGNSFGASAVLGTLDAQPLSLVANNSTVASFLSNGNITLGNGTSVLSVSGTIGSDLIPSTNNTYDLGSAGSYWADAYIDTLTVNNISAASTSIGGTVSEDFVINTDNATNDTENMTITFFRGIATPNALLSWNSTRDRFEFNQPLYVENLSSTTTVPTLALRATAGQTASVLDLQTSAGATFLAATPSGFLGIGTSSPFARLSVDGDTYLEGDLTTTATATVATLSIGNGGTGAASFTGGLLVGNGTNAFITRILTAPAAGITVSNGDGVSGNPTLALANDLAALEGLGSTGIAVRTASDTWAQRTLTGSVQITVADGDGVAGNPTLSITADSIGDSQLTFNTGQNLTTLSSPTFAGLTLSSPLGVASGGTGASSLSGLLQGNGTSAITAVTGTAGQFPYYNGTNTLTATSSIFLATSGNVGIGTTTPSANLDVYSASSFGWLSVTTGTSGSFNAAQVAINRGDTANGYATINFYSNLEGVEDWQMGTRAGDSKLHFLSGGADTRMVIDNVNGYVGIGASDPLNRLAVVATSTNQSFGQQINLRSLRTAITSGNLVGGISVTSNDTNLTAPGAKVAAIDFLANTTHTASALGTDIVFSSTNGTTFAELMRITAAGNVGIGTTTPASRLVVQGTGTGSVYLGEWGGGSSYGALSLNGSLASGNYNFISSASDPNLYINRPLGRDIVFRENNADQVVIQNTTGNVGIGDPSPSALLTVGSGDLFQVNSSGAIAAATGITSSGTITFSGLTAGGVVSAAAGTGVLSVGTIGASGVTADSLDFTEFQDQLDLDASTDILADGSEFFSITNSGTGNSFLVNDSACDTTPFVIDASGNVGIGTTSPVAKLTIDSGVFQIGNTSALHYAGASVKVSSDLGTELSLQASYASGRAGLSLIRTRGTVDAPTAVTLDDSLGFLGFKGYDGTAAQLPALVEAFVDGTVSTGVVPARLSFVTGSNGATRAERLTIKNDGLVGIGTTTPSGNLSVYASSLPIISLIDGSQTAGNRIWINRVNNGVYNIHPAIDAGSASATGLTINRSGYVGVGTTTAAARMQVYNTASVDSFLVEDEANDTTPFVINASGNVGVGTTLPGNLIHAKGSSSATIQVESDGTGNGQARLRVTNPTNDWLIYSASTNSLIIYDLLASLPRVTVNSSGYVGIGVASPTSILNIGTSKSDTSWTTTGKNFAVNANTLTDTSGTGTITTRVANSFGIPTFASDNAVTITNAATLYIAGAPAAGTNTTLTNSNALHVKGSTLIEAVSGTLGLTISRTSAEDGSAPMLRIIPDSSKTIFQSYGEMTFQTAALSGSLTEGMRIDTSGNVGIGTTSPLAKLHIYTAAAGIGAVSSAGDDLVLENSTTAGMSIIGGTSSDTGLYFGDSGSQTMGRVIYANSTDSMQFWTAAIQRMTIDSSGNVGIGTATPNLGGVGGTSKVLPP